MKVKKWWITIGCIVCAAFSVNNGWAGMDSLRSEIDAALKQAIMDRLVAMGANPLEEMLGKRVKTAK